MGSKNSKSKKTSEEHCFYTHLKRDGASPELLLGRPIFFFP